MCGCKWKISVEDAARPPGCGKLRVVDSLGAGLQKRAEKNATAGGDEVPNNTAVNSIVHCLPSL